MKALLTVLVMSALAAGSCLAAPVDRVAGERIPVEVRFEQSQFSFTKAGGYDYAYAEGMSLLPEPGLPGLPMKQVQVALPYRSRAASVEVVRVEELELAGTFNIAPTQPPRVLGQEPAAWVPGRQAVYASDEAYPASAVAGVHQGYMGDTRFLSFFVSPLRWHPATGALMLATRLEIVVNLEAAPVERGLRARPAAARDFLDAVRRSVVNPEDVKSEGFAAEAIGFSPGALLGASALEQGHHEYVVITTEALAPYFQPLVDWKTEKGLAARLETSEWIGANYTGLNIQEKIRNFIIDAYQTWGTCWVLLGGDTDQIPSRQVFAMNCEMGPEGNRIRSDLYYSDLDGTWNDNGVSPYGEVADNVDMYPDVVVGRAPAETPAEAEVFVEKVLAYEQNPPAGYALDVLLAGEVLWDDPLTDAGVGLDMIDEQCIPPRFDPLLKLYETLGNESRETVLAAMAAGQHLVLHDGHCNEYSMGVGGSYINVPDADTLSNGARAFILNSIGCWPAAIDRNCIAEHFINNPDGGGIAFVGNCRYGWGSPGNPGIGYSDDFQREFAGVLLKEEVRNLGLANAISKARFVPYAQDENVYRWNEYQVNLLGDPEMPVWTDEPGAITVVAPERVLSPQGEVRVAVADVAGAVADAMVCLMNGSDVYLVAHTDLGGVAAFEVTTASGDSLLLTVTAPNRRPHQRRIEVITSGRLLEVADFGVLDGGDGKANPGETVNLAVSVGNSGTEQASGVWGVLRSRDGLAEVLDSTVYYGSVAGGSASWGAGTFTVTFDQSCANAQAVVLDLVLSDTTAAEWTSAVQPVVAAPVFEVTSYGMHDLLGDADWMAEPGETVIVTLEITNRGLAAGSPTASASSSDPMFAVTDSISSCGTVEAGGVGHSLHRVVISPACPGAYAGAIQVATASPGGYAFEDTVYLAVGELAFSDDCESGAGGWVREGSPDMWHLSTYRSHSGSTSWYFGDPGTHRYVSGADASLTTRGLVAGDRCKLSFWFWYEFTTYGVDGLYVIVTADGVPDTLDYIGSGGALNIWSRWVPWERDLDVTPGDSLALSFAFKSDGGDTAEGVYIDDMTLSVVTPGEAWVPPAVPEPGAAFRAYPNPAAGSLTFSFPSTRAAVMDVYDVRGRQVASLTKPAGASTLVWDIDAEQDIASGIYLAKVRNAGNDRAQKIVVVR